MKAPTLLDKVRQALADKAPKDLTRIAVAVDVTAETLRNIRSGDTDPRFSTVQALAEYLDVLDAKDKRKRADVPAVA